MIIVVVSIYFHPTRRACGRDSYHCIGESCCLRKYLSRELKQKPTENRFTDVPGRNPIATNIQITYSVSYATGTLFCALQPECQ